MKLQIKKIGINGEGIAYLKRKPVFIMRTLPDETALVRISEDHGRYLRGEAERILVKNAHRVMPECHLQKKCGGCPLMIADYLYQLMLKKQILVETLEKYAELTAEVKDVQPSASLTGYRNKLSLPVADDNGHLANAMYQTETNIPVVFDSCPIHSERLETIRKTVLSILGKAGLRPYDRKLKKGIRHLMIRGFREYQVVLVTGKDSIDKQCIDEIAGISDVASIYQGINIQKETVSPLPDDLKLLYGKPCIEFEMLGYRFNLRPKSFFQLNIAQAENIYREVIELAGLQNQLIVEAYCGIGVMSTLLADKAKQVIGIDIEKSAIDDARQSAELNGKKNISFICDDASKAVTELSRKRQIDVLVIDPPRSGIDEKLIETLNRSNIRKIIYVSCNPATLAKNIHDLYRYEMREVMPYDMFANSQHIETVVLLNRKAGR